MKLPGYFPKRPCDTRSLEQLPAGSTALWLIETRFNELHKEIFPDTYFLDSEIVSIPLRSIKKVFFFPSSLPKHLRQLSSCVFLMSSLNGSMRFFSELTEVVGAFWEQGQENFRETLKVISLGRLRGAHTFQLKIFLDFFTVTQVGRKEARESMPEGFNKSLIGEALPFGFILECSLWASQLHPIG